jgi:hypothetical protein
LMSVKCNLSLSLALSLVGSRVKVGDVELHSEFPS